MSRTTAPLPLRDKVVVITGAASGIGRALAVDAARRGAVLALSDVDAAGLDAHQAHAALHLHLEGHVALLVGNLALAGGPFLVRHSGVGPISAGFWRVALALPFLWLVARLFRQPVAVPRRAATVAIAVFITVVSRAITNCPVADVSRTIPVAPAVSHLGRRLSVQAERAARRISRA